MPVRSGEVGEIQPLTYHLELTCIHVDHTIWVAGGNKAILYQQALVVMGTIINESLLITLYSGDSPDLVARVHMIETGRHLETNNNNTNSLSLTL